MAKAQAKGYQPQTPGVIAANKARKARQHSRRMARQARKCDPLLKRAWPGDTRAVARRDITAWKNRRKARLQAQAGTVQGRTPTLTRVFATIEHQVEA